MGEEILLRKAIQDTRIDPLIKHFRCGKVKM
jgi:hypothetical protein